MIRRCGTVRSVCYSCFQDLEYSSGFRFYLTSASPCISIDKSVLHVVALKAQLFPSDNCRSFNNVCHVARCCLNSWIYTNKLVGNSKLLTRDPLL